ncbi:hypothetical protein BD777DRAFT_132524 [Yarrowia lipolytica]|nr:hypothetical protein BD777DRAFT_132524 [Yarrowia lipolytica]
MRDSMTRAIPSLYQNINCALVDLLSVVDGVTWKYGYKWRLVFIWLIRKHYPVSLEWQMGYHILQQQNRKYELGYFHGCVLGESLILGTEALGQPSSTGEGRERYENYTILSEQAQCYFDYLTPQFTALDQYRYPLLAPLKILHPSISGLHLTLAKSD